MPRQKDPASASDRLQLPSTRHLRESYLRIAAKLEPRILESLGATCLDIYRRLFPPRPRPPEQQNLFSPRERQVFIEQQEAQIFRDVAEIACAIAALQGELTTEAEVARGEMGDNYKWAATAKETEPPTLVHPAVVYRDPSPHAELGRVLKQQRLARHTTIKAEAARLGILASELMEIERGCMLRAGLTTYPGTEPLRLPLRIWLKRWHLPEWALDWALHRLRFWPPTDPLDYPLHTSGITHPTPDLRAWRRYSDPEDPEEWETYLEYTQETLAFYKKFIILLESKNLKELWEPQPSKRGPRKGSTHPGSVDRHVQWLVGYQTCGWSKNAIADAAEKHRRAVQHAIQRLAEQIGLELRSPDQNDPELTPDRIRAALQRLT
jgi:hypothetical protein